MACLRPACPAENAVQVVQKRLGWFRSWGCGMVMALSVGRLPLHRGPVSSAPDGWSQPPAKTGLQMFQVDAVVEVSMARLRPACPAQNAVRVVQQRWGWFRSRGCGMVVALSVGRVPLDRGLGSAAPE